MKKIITNLLILLTIIISLTINAANKVIVIPMGSSASANLQYTGVTPIIVNNDTNTITFDRNAALSGYNSQPSLVLNYVIALQGVYPSRNSIYDPTMGEISLVGYNFAPRSWAYCQGQLLSIAQNSALFSLLGTTFGGDGRTTFGLPDLRGRVPVGAGNGPGLSPRSVGQRFGTE